MFENIREDYRIHGRKLRSRAFWAMAVYRFGIWSLNRRFPPWRWFTSKLYGLGFAAIRVLTGISMDRTVKVGQGFHLIHPGLISIHPQTVFGDRCGIMHGVTIGINMTGKPPVIGNDVFIGCLSSVLGEITIGDGARIAANSLVISNVPPGAVAMGVPAKVFPGLASTHLRSKVQASPVPLPVERESPSR